MANFNTHLRKDQIMDALNGGLNAVQPDDLSTVATSGRYADLLEKPVVDELPIADSDNLVSSGGVASAIETVKDAIAEQTDSGGKNCVQPTATTQTISGIEWTVNSDGTITATGTATANSYITVQVLAADSVFDGDYYLSGCPEGGSDSTYALYVARGSYTKYDYGNGIVLSESTDGLNKNLLAIVYSGQTVTDLTFKPMICKKSYWDVSHNYVPYCPTMQELYQMILDLGGGNRSMQVESEQEVR